MTDLRRVLLQDVGAGMFLGVIIGAVANSNPFGAVTYILAALGAALWLAAMFAFHPRAGS